jgi:CubicO group peptidase (beta-lactamase class C family)
MTKTKILARITALALAGASFAGVAASTPAFAGDIQNKTADPQKMAAYVDGVLANQVNGYAVAVYKDGQLVASEKDGYARNGDAQFFEPTTRMEIASTTKTFTALATLMLLERNGLSVDTKVNGYFPYDWNRGSGWQNVTFRMLLSHRSGMKQQIGTDPNFTTSWAGVQYAIGKPIQADNSYAYTNMNYSALRVLIPRLWKLAEPTNGQPSLNSTNSGQIVMAFSNKYILGPAGIGGVSCASTPNTALAYDGNDSQLAGSPFELSGSQLEECHGNRGLVLSAVEVAKFHDALRNGKIASQAVRDLMENKSGHYMGELGYDPGSNDEGTDRVGSFYHGGDLFGGVRETHTCGAKLPNGFSMGLLMNSPNNTGMVNCRILINAYLAGWQ